MENSEGEEISTREIKKELRALVDAEDKQNPLTDDELVDALSEKGYKVARRTVAKPTANMQLYEPLKLIPGRGVYETEVETLGCHFKGMTNIGVRPTVGKGNALTVETNIFDFDEEIYGRDITVRFVRKIRDEKPFPSLEALSAQLALDRSSIVSK